MNLLRPLLDRIASAAGQPPAGRSSFVNDLDAPLLALNDENDVLRVRDFCEGIFVLGATGSGKSSGTGAAAAMAMLSAGWGGVVLCAKPDEATRWAGYLQACGRSGDLILMQPGSGWNFNFIEHELRRPDGMGADVFNLVQLMMVIVESMRVALGMPAEDSGTFWISAMRELLANAIEPLVAATGRFRLDELMRFITSAPTSPQDMQDEAWRARSYWYWTMEQAFDAPLGPPLPEASRHAMQDYWLGNFARLDPKTRSNIVATLTATISPFLRGALREACCTDTTVVPELAHEGAVIVVDWPIKTTGPAGAMMGQIMKYRAQRATEARLVGPNTRPFFIFADEAQLFMSAYDKEFQSTARSSLAATVYLTQNLPNYYALQPGRDAKAATDGLLGNFQTKIFHANTDHTTNQYAADLIGKRLLRRESGNWTRNSGWSEGENRSEGLNFQRGWNEGKSWGGGTSSSVSTSSSGPSSSSVGWSSHSGGQEGTNHSRGRNSSHGVSAGVSGGWSAGGGWSEQMDYLVPPDAYARELRKGGPANDFMVDGVLVQGGRRFNATGAHWLPLTFRQ